MVDWLDYEYFMENVRYVCATAGIVCVAVLYIAVIVAFVVALFKKGV